MMTRFDYIDKLRGFAILLVVIGHIYLPYTREASNHPVAQMIYSFHMPLFFFISGFLCEFTHKIEKNGYLNFVWRKAIALLVPYLFWLIAGDLIFKHGEISAWTDIPRLLCFFPNVHFWFMPVLFILMLLYALHHWMMGKRDSVRRRVAFVFVLCLLLVGFGGIFHLFHLMVYAIYAFSFFFGAFLSFRPRALELIKRDKVYGSMALLLCIAWLFYPLHANGNPLLSIYNLVGMFVCSFSAIIVFFNFFFRMRLPRFLHWFFSEMGKYSLVIYLTPVFILPKGFFIEGFTMSTENIIVIFLGIVQCLIAYGIGRVVYEIPYLRLLVYGKMS